MKDRQRKNEGIARVVEQWGYSQREVADYLGWQYSTVSRIMGGSERATNKT